MFTGANAGETESRRLLSASQVHIEEYTRRKSTTVTFSINFKADVQSAQESQYKLTTFLSDSSANGFRVALNSHTDSDFTVSSASVTAGPVVAIVRDEVSRYGGDSVAAMEAWLMVILILMGLSFIGVSLYVYQWGIEGLIDTGKHVDDAVIMLPVPMEAQDDMNDRMVVHGVVVRGSAEVELEESLPTSLTMNPGLQIYPPGPPPSIDAAPRINDDDGRLRLPPLGNPRAGPGGFAPQQVPGGPGAPF